MKTIEYIQFAIDNGYNFTNGKYYIHHNYREEERDYNDNQSKDVYYDWYFIFHKCADIWCDIVSLEKIITSKPFLEAIARATIDIENEVKTWVIEDTKENRESFYNAYLDEITYEQAIAIRDDKLEEFINEILGNIKKV